MFSVSSRPAAGMIVSNKHDSGTRLVMTNKFLRDLFLIGSIQSDCIDLGQVGDLTFHKHRMLMDVKPAPTCLRSDKTGLNRSALKQIPQEFGAEILKLLVSHEVMHHTEFDAIRN